MADVVWVLLSAALVLFMIPGLALFYGGMTRSKNVLNMLNMSMYCVGVVPFIWVALGWTLASSASEGGSAFIGNLDLAFLQGMEITAEDGAVDLREFVFLMTFACITPALISGAVADRMKFSAWMVFVPMWTLVVYAPVVFWVYSGWILDLPAHDFAGGTAIHINAGAAALALVLVLGKRKHWRSEPFPPHNLTLVVIGTGILWFGWFGFNAGSELAANARAVVAFVNTFLAASAGMVGWMVMDLIRSRKVTTLGICSGIVAGLVSITPAAGFVEPGWAFVFGLAAGVLCFYAINLKEKLGYDDSLDVVGIHMVGGIVGGLLIGLFAHATTVLDFEQEGLFFDGGWKLLVNQAVSIVAVLAFSFVVTYLLAKFLDLTIGLRVDSDIEERGLDTTEHAENAYVL